MFAFFSGRMGCLGSSEWPKATAQRDVRLGVLNSFSREMAPLPAQGTSQGDFHSFRLSRFLGDARFRRSECLLIAFDHFFDH
jgi:hypothetical protein